MRWRANWCLAGGDAARESIARGDKRPPRAARAFGMPSTARMRIMAEDVARALGMSVSLCRSSSIAGQFVRGVGGLFESAANVQQE